jgi:hypothetical protein
VLDVVRADGDYLNDAQAELTLAKVATGIRKSEPLTGVEPALRLTAPGRYEADVRLPDDGIYLATVRWRDEQNKAQAAHCSLTVDYPHELTLRPTNETLLRNVAAASRGYYNRSLDSIGSYEGRYVERTWPLWQALTLASLLMFVIDTGLRRKLAAQRPITK